MTEPLVIELQFGAVPVTVTVGLEDIFGLAAHDRDALFSFVDYAKTAATNGAAPQPVTPPQLIKPRFVKEGRAKTTEVCDECDRTFDTVQGLTLHKRRAHQGYDPKAAKRGTMPTPLADAVAAAVTTPKPSGVLELTCETCNAPLPTIEKLKAHTVARHGRDPRPTELVENRGPR